MFSWIGWIWSIQAKWGSTWLIGVVIAACVGLVCIGMLFESLGPTEGDRGPICAFSTLVVGIISAFWPILLIGAPFIAVALSLFYSGVYMAQSFKRSAEVRAGKTNDQLAQRRANENL